MTGCQKPGTGPQPCGEGFCQWKVEIENFDFSTLLDSCSIFPRMLHEYKRVSRYCRLQSLKPADSVSGSMISQRANCELGEVSLKWNPFENQQYVPVVPQIRHANAQVCCSITVMNSHLLVVGVADMSSAPNLPGFWKYHEMGFCLPLITSLHSRLPEAFAKSLPRG